MIRQAADLATPLAAHPSAGSGHRNTADQLLLWGGQVVGQEPEAVRAQVAADPAYQNARIEHDQALARVMTGLFKDDMELFKQFSDNESFRRWLTDMIFNLTYQAAVGQA